MFHHQRVSIVHALPCWLLIYAALDYGIDYCARYVEAWPGLIVLHHLASTPSA